ncbi:MAG: response regulator transcription factor [Chloroflexi bacterium]|nr:response regulator transcription factor [Chloroflexota bacterium]
MPSRTILIIDDNASLLESLRRVLEAEEGYDVHTAQSGERGLELAQNVQPELIILDLILPGIDGFEVCRIIRQQSDVPIIILTARNEEIDRVLGLEIGADDYLTKPFSMRELVARVRAAFRRRNLSSAGTSDDNPLQIIASGNLMLNLTNHEATLGGQHLRLKPREFQLLTLLVRNRGKVCTRDFILERLWGDSDFEGFHTLAVHIRWLREKVEENPSRPARIVTVRGVGYRFDG